RGTVRLFGRDPWQEGPALQWRLAYVACDVSLWPNLSGREAVDLLLRMRRPDPARSRKAELVKRFRLDLTMRARAYSRGNRQKVALVAALATDTDLPGVELRIHVHRIGRRTHGATPSLSRPCSPHRGSRCRD